jgi:Protein of unknown function (DUF2735)
MEPNMTTNSDRASAQVIQFPARGRFAADRVNEEKPATSAVASRVAKVAIGGAWYHDEAIRESEGASNS